MDTGSVVQRPFHTPVTPRKFPTRPDIREYAFQHTPCMVSAYKSPDSIDAYAYGVVASRLIGNWPYRLTNALVSA